MVGGFVHDDHLWDIEEELGERDFCSFAAGECFYFLVRFVAAHVHLSEDIAHAGLAVARGGEELRDSGVRVEVCQDLRKVADGDCAIFGILTV